MRRLDRIRPRLDFIGGAVRFAGPDIEFPAVPWAADDLSPTAIAVATGSARFDETGDRTLTETSALMRAAIEHSEKVPTEIEDRNRTALDREQFARSRRNIAGRGHDMAAHALTPYSASAFSRKKD